MEPVEKTTGLFEQYRGLLFGIAYRMLGSVSDAEDVVQEAFVRWLQADTNAVQSAKAYLTSVVVRLCIDHARLARVKREVYTGQWLPEPVRTDGWTDLSDSAIMRESISFAFMLMMENLSPIERAVFLLREVFDYSYPEIAAMVGKSESNCRQMLHRAHQHLDQRRNRFPVTAEQREKITGQFAQALVQADVQSLLNMLTPDAVFIGDGGGKSPTARNPIYGRDNLVRGTLGALQKFWSGIEGRFAEVNGYPAIEGYLNGRLIGVMLFDVTPEGIHAIYGALNPDKLEHLQPAQA